MPSFVRQIFESGISNTDKQYGMARRHLPMLNEITGSFGTYMWDTNQIRKKQALMSWFKSIPELAGFVNKFAVDATGRFKFVPVNPTESGRNKLLKAQKFADEIKLRRVNNAHFADMLVTGEAYGWLGKISESVVKGIIEKTLKTYPKFNLETKEEFSSRVDDMYNYIRTKESTERKELGDVTYYDKSPVDEDVLKPRKYRYMPSSTVEVIYDKYDIIKYKQQVGTDYDVFNPDEILRYTLMNRDGRVTGFTPLETMIMQLELLRQMWTNMLSVQNNGGMMDTIVSFKNANPNSPAFTRTVEEFKKYRNVENRHGIYLTTGDLVVQNMQQIENMQYENMGLYITGLLALQWGFPRSSIPFIQGSVNTKDDTGGNSEKGYWEVVRSFQNIFADDQNQQLWIPYFGVKIEFENPYFQVNVQEQQYYQMKFNNVQLLQNMLRSNKMKLKDTTLKNMLCITDEDVEELSDEDLMMGAPLQGGPSSLNKQISNSDANDSDDKKNKNNRKREEQVATQSSRGKATGTGKEFCDWDMLSEKELLETKEVDSEHVSFDTFTQLYQEEVRVKQDPPRIFVRQNTEIITFFFKGKDYTFKSIIPTSEWDEYRNKAMLLSGGKIWRV